MLLACMLTLPICSLKFYQIIIVLSFTLSPSTMTSNISPNPEVGIVNQVFGIYLDWLGNGVLALALALAAVALTWKNPGYNVIFYIAAFHNLSKEIDQVRQN